MPYKVKDWLPCNECGVSTNRRQAVTCQPLCLECSAEVMEANIHQLQSRRGPAYLAWLAGMARFAAREDMGGGVPSSDDV